MRKAKTAGVMPAVFATEKRKGINEKEILNRLT
jgi:hypothetical protein